MPEYAVGDTIIPTLPGDTDPRTPSEPGPRARFGARAVVSSRKDAVPQRSATPPASTPWQARIQTDAQTRLGYISCPGLTIVGVETSKEFAQAVGLIESLQRGVRDKGTIIVPLRSRMRSDPRVLGALARRGIVAVRGEVDGLQDAIIKYARDYMVLYKTASHNLEAFMKAR